MSYQVSRALVDPALAVDCPHEVRGELLVFDLSLPCAQAIRERAWNGVPVPPPQSVPRNQWPAWATTVAKLSKAEDVGVGSTVKRLAGPMGEAFKTWAEKLGVPCACSDRELLWNLQYPYE